MFCFHKSAQTNIFSFTDSTNKAFKLISSISNKSNLKISIDRDKNICDVLVNSRGVLQPQLSHTFARYVSTHPARVPNVTRGALNLTGALTRPSRYDANIMYSLCQLYNKDRLYTTTFWIEKKCAFVICAATSRLQRYIFNTISSVSRLHRDCIASASLQMRCKKSQCVRALKFNLALLFT